MVKIKGTMIEVCDIQAGKMELRLEIYKNEVDHTFYAKLFALTIYLIQAAALPEGRVSGESIFSEYEGLIDEEHLKASSLDELKANCMKALAEQFAS